LSERDIPESRSDLAHSPVLAILGNADNRELRRRFGITGLIDAAADGVLLAEIGTHKGFVHYRNLRRFLPVALIEVAAEHDRNTHGREIVRAHGFRSGPRSLSGILTPSTRIPLPQLLSVSTGTAAMDADFTPGTPRIRLMVRSTYGSTWVSEYPAFLGISVAWRRCSGANPS
jgi:hypothetical protein